MAATACWSTSCEQGDAARLYITERTVEAHVLKLRLDEHPGSHRRVLAVLTFLRA